MSRAVPLESATWIRVRRVGAAFVFECRRCGGEDTTDLPMAVEAWIQRARAFHRAHEGCHPRLCPRCAVPMPLAGGPGRPPVYCSLECRRERKRERDRRYYERNRDQVAEQQRRYRERNRDKIKLRIAARAEARDRGCTLDEVLREWGATS